jgi:hypothetical protein
MGQNPFTPSFGVTPPKLVGREEELNTFADALDSGPGAPGRSILFTGLRGSGKTVLLNAIESLAESRGWLVVSDTARPGLVESLTLTVMPRVLRTVDPDGEWISGVSVSAAGFGGSVNREPVERHQVVPDFRSQLEELADVAERKGVGVLLSIDEIHSGAIDDIREVAQAVQHCFRRSRQVAFAAAGLPNAVADILNDDVISFLRRSEQFSLGSVTEPDTIDAIESPIIAYGKQIAPDALEMAAESSMGFPFLMQLIGYHAWLTGKQDDVITVADVQKAFAKAKQQMDRKVYLPALHDLSEKDLEFLHAMSRDDGPSSVAEVAIRMNVTRSYANQYRRRLIAADMIHPTGLGLVDFSIPYMRDYLRNTNQQ